ncbi:MAG: acyl-CoA dehydrogenase family protein [Deinococcales bacterium]
MIAERPEAVASVKPGGTFMLEAATAQDVRTPEDFTPDMREMFAAVEEFVKARVVANQERLEHHDNELLKKILHECGEQGFFLLEVPEEFGGLDMSKTMACYVGEALSRGGGFAVSFGAHASIGMLPLVYFGSQATKEKYLPDMANGKLIGAYCLSEPGSGSDAQAAKARAVLSEDGRHYILNGTKMWISNGGIADIFTVFAHVPTPEGNKFSAFLVERKWDGVSTGKEEEKLGIRLSSTTQLILEDVKVPAENLLGEVGWGAKIAFNILNIGRYKLGSGGAGGGKVILEHSAKYAKERHSFGKPIASYGAILEKLGAMATSIYGAESITYRVTGAIDAAVEKGMDKLKAIETHRVEASIVKVYGTEVLSQCADEGVQVFGGFGYSEEYPMARAYRDARINRIFEGTNEINRMLIPGELLKMAMKGELGLLKAAQKLQAELLEPQFDFEEPEGLLAAETKVVANLKKAALAVAGSAAMRLGTKMSEEQEVMMRVADMIIQAYVAETATVRAQKSGNALHAKMAQILVAQAADKTMSAGREAISSFLTGDEFRMTMAALKRFTKTEVVNLIALRREVAQAVLEKDGYPA